MGDGITTPEALYKHFEPNSKRQLYACHGSCHLFHLVVQVYAIWNLEATTVAKMLADEMFCCFSPFRTAPQRPWAPA